MIPVSVEKVQPKKWQSELADLINTPETLLALLQTEQDNLTAIKRAHDLFPLRLPRRYAERLLTLDDPRPLLRQFIPSAAELIDKPDFVADPLAEVASTQQPGLLQKYAGRVLLTVTQACAVHCRYCFRRHFPYQDNNPGRNGWQQIFKTIQADPSIKEVIFSGGDPLSLADEHLFFFLDAITAINTVTTVRFHTRLPAILPSRLTPQLIEKLKNLPQRVVVVLHINHGDEIWPDLQQATKLLHCAGITVLNQSVLLAGVNNDLQTLATLQERLFLSHIQPYYLHLLDKVKGAWHFAVPLEQAKALHLQLQAKLPGYLVPHLSQEVPGHSNKVRV